MAAIEAAERALDRELIEAGGAETARTEVEATVAAARAAARAAMDSLRRGSGSRHQEDDLKDEEGVFASRQVSPTPRHWCRSVAISPLPLDRPVLTFRWS